MAFVTTTYRNAGGGGGDTAGYQTDQFEVATPFAPGSVTLNLSFTPVSKGGVVLSLNGQTLAHDQWTLAGNVITILFGEIYTYEDPYTFFATYPYT